jgi:hypothetical protein
VPAIDIVGSDVAEDDAFSRLEFFDLDVDLVEMRLAVRSSVDPHDFHGSGLIEKSRVKSN